MKDDNYEIDSLYVCGVGKPYYSNDEHSIISVHTEKKLLLLKLLKSLDNNKTSLTYKDVFQDDEFYVFRYLTFKELQRKIPNDVVVNNDDLIPFRKYFNISDELSMITSSEYNDYYFRIQHQNDEVLDTFLKEIMDAKNLILETTYDPQEYNNLINRLIELSDNYTSSICSLYDNTKANNIKEAKDDIYLKYASELERIVDPLKEKLSILKLKANCENVKEYLKEI